MVIKRPPRNADFIQNVTGAGAVKAFCSKQSLCHIKKEIFLSNVVSPLNKLFMKVFAKKLGCKGSLNDKPYQNYIKR